MSKTKKGFMIGIALLILILVGIYWGLSFYSVSTDDAYINANVVQITPRVSGPVIRLYVVNNEHVKKDQPLFDIDPAIYQVQVNEARAQVNRAKAERDIAEITARRTSTLVKRNFAAAQQGDSAHANLDAENASVQLAEASLARALLNLSYTHVTAPMSGWVTNVSLRPGSNVAYEQSVFALIGDQEFWVDTNLKETELYHIHPGQKAEIKVDMYPGHVFDGEVESISGGSGTVFSLLPPQNATGNWVKVTQRVPVRVRILKVDPKHPLRIGTTATVKIFL